MASNRVIPFDALTWEIVRARARYHRYNGWKVANSFREAVEEQWHVGGARYLIFPGRLPIVTTYKSNQYVPDT